MTKAEAATLGGIANARRYAGQRERLRLLLAEGVAMKVAAWEAGMAYRSARRYRAR